MKFLSLFQSAIVYGTIILYGAVGEILTQKSGNLNLGVPGLMSLGAVGGFITARAYEVLYCGSAGISPAPLLCILIALIGSLLFSGLGGLLYSFLTITLRANQNVTGLTLTIFGCALANYYGSALLQQHGGVGSLSLSVTSNAFRAVIPGLENVTVFYALGWLVYVSIAIALVMQWFLNRTRVGLNLRAVGESPATADAAGINVTKYKYVATCVGACISGLGGLYYFVDYVKAAWTTDGTLEALGWLAVALVIFATWKPARAIWASYLFGALSWLYFYIGGLNRSSQEIFKMLPYAVTIAVLVIVSLRHSKESQPPASLGLSYFREAR